jgi:hypothetical protein
MEAASPISLGFGLNDDPRIKIRRLALARLTFRISTDAPSSDYPETNVKT